MLVLKVLLMAYGGLLFYAVVIYPRLYRNPTYWAWVDGLRRGRKRPAASED